MPNVLDSLIPWGAKCARFSNPVGCQNGQISRFQGAKWVFLLDFWLKSAKTVIFTRFFWLKSAENGDFTRFLAKIRVFGPLGGVWAYPLLFGPWPKQMEGPKSMEF